MGKELIAINSTLRPLGVLSLRSLRLNLLRQKPQGTQRFKFPKSAKFSKKSALIFYTNFCHLQN